MPSDLTSDSGLCLTYKQQLVINSKFDLKNNCFSSGLTNNPTTTSSINNNNNNHSINSVQNLSTDPSQQFNIFPAIFSRQLNFSTPSSTSSSSAINSIGNTIATSSSSSLNHLNSNSVLNTQGKLMDDLRPNLVGGLLGLQQGLLDDHALAAHGNLQHSSHQDTKFMSLQDNRLMGITSHENRLLGLSQDLRSAATMNNLDNNKNSTIAHQNRKCNSTPEDFSSLYGGLSSGLGDTSSHHHTPAHTPPSRLGDHTITGKAYFETVK